MTRKEFEALPVFSIAGETRVVTDPTTGESRLERVPQRFLVHHDAFHVLDERGALWLVFTDQDAKTWRQPLWITH